MPVNPKQPRGYEQKTVSSAAVSLTVAPSQVLQAITQTVFTPSNAIRWRDDGTDPTASIGYPVAASQVFIYDGPPQTLRMIRSGGSDAVVDVLYYSG